MKMANRKSVKYGFTDNTGINTGNKEKTHINIFMPSFYHGRYIFVFSLSFIEPQRVLFM